MEVKIVDSAFGHTDFSTLQKTNLFKWYRGNEKRRVCFYTDKSLPKVVNGIDDINVAWLIEPRVIDGLSYKYIEANHHLFDYILTYDKHLLSLGEKFLFYPHGGCWVNDEDKKLHNKTKFCSIIASNKKQSVGHKLRHEVIKVLGSDVDVFGGENPINNKIEGLKEYKYTIVIENSKQDDYFTEKLIDSFVTGTIPLYWGTDNIKNYFTNIHTFNTTDELKGIIERLKLIEYDSKNAIVNYDKSLSYIMPEIYFYNNYKTLFE